MVMRMKKMFVYLCFGIVLAGVCLGSASEYFDAERASGIWVFDLFAADKEEFTSKSIDDAAKMVCADNPYIKDILNITN